MMRDRLRHLFAQSALVAVTLPPAAVLVAGGAILLGALAGTHPAWPEDRPSISEAIILRDLGALLEGLRANPDMTKKYPVGPGMIRDGESYRLTPFEAAIAARRDDVVLFLQERGVTPSPTELPHLRCVAILTDARALTALFGAPADPATCADVAVPW